MLRGGGVAFGPKPRSFATELQKKVYDKAWRMALSHRYRRGELVVIERAEDVESDAVSEILEVLGWGNAGGRSLFVTGQEREGLFRGLSKAGQHGRALIVDDVDVKDLLELGRVVVEKQALDSIFKRHKSDVLKPKAKIGLTTALPSEEVEELIEAASPS